MFAKLVDSVPCTVHLFPDDHLVHKYVYMYRNIIKNFASKLLYLSVIGAGGKDATKLWMGPIHLPRRTFMTAEKNQRQ